MTPTDALSAEDHARVAEFAATRTPVASPAKRLLGPDATDAQWLDARRWRVGASELSAVIPGVHNPNASPYSLWWAKQSGWTLDDTPALEIGRELEPVIGKLFAKQRPDLLLCRPNGRLFVHPNRGWLSCTPDFLAVSVDVRACPCTTPEGALNSCTLCHGDGRTVRPRIEPVEAKSDEGGPGWGAPGTDEIPEHHWYQLMVQCYVFGAERGHLVRLAGKRLRAYTVAFDAEDEGWKRGLAAGRAFWASLSDVDNVPDVDEHPATEATLAALHPAVDDTRTEYVSAALRAEYDDARHARKAAQDHERGVQSRLRLAMRDAKYAAVSGEEPFVERRVFKHPGCVIPPHPVDGLWPKG